MGTAFSIVLPVAGPLRASLELGLVQGVSALAEVRSV